MKVIVVGKTDVVINLNKTGIPIRGKVQAILNVNNEEQRREVRGLINDGLIEVLSSEDDSIKVVNVKVSAPKEEESKPYSQKMIKGKVGRPKGSKNKNQEPTEQQRVSAAEARTKEMGSRVVIGTRDGAKESRMYRSAIEDMPDSEKTRESIDAMKKLEKEEKEDISLPDTYADESKLDASEQMGRNAVVATESGVKQKGMVRSILPEAEAVKKVDPFIDRQDKKEIAAQGFKEEEFPPVDTNKVEEDADDADAFIKI